MTWAVRSATGRPCANRSSSSVLRFASTPICWLRSAVPNATRPDAPTTSTWPLPRRRDRAWKPLWALADALRKDAVGEDVTYVVNRNINFTNICYTGCRFCAFAQRKGDADAFTLSAEQVADRAWEAHVAGATEVCMQGGIDPELPVTGYADLVRAVKKRVPSMHVHAFSPMEIVNGASRSGESIRDWLTALREAGLDTIPGTAAEILDDEVRWILTKGKLPTAEWIEVVTTAHEVGLRFEFDDDVRACRSAAPLGRAPERSSRNPGPYRRIHGVRAAAVRSPERAPVPGGRLTARADQSGQPRCARAGTHHAARPHTQHPDQLGQTWHHRNADGCSTAAPTTSAER